LRIYSKKECPLCDGLKDKVALILERAPFSGSKLKDVDFEIKDINENPEWVAKFSMEVPVLSVLVGDQEVREDFSCKNVSIPVNQLLADLDIFLSFYRALYQEVLHALRLINLRDILYPLSKIICKHSIHTYLLLN